ncbi:hypothetical protein SRS16P2_00311 (plasmid) [Variovorax sp. SRS16]|uniref:hypothetical protein n=1 Tax=Variovorax sp. SRS16 TaxID=282217 RepID=UPI00131889F8|nr:hypothetical protein [Variovorax sp. SRS16]VTU45758.1 hypothetical protein SRS16P2_00311 [Variovorax sp. SRS16]
MERIGTVEKKTRTRVFDEGNFRGYTEYLIETEAGPRPAPQAFLVHQQPGWVLPTHFHLEEQFQVVTRGGGTLGAHALDAVSIHYASREAGYGPLVAGADGLDYLTLRTVTDPGAWYLPESREKMRKGLRKRQESVGPVRVSTSASLAELAQPATEVLIASDASGLAAWVVRVPPCGRATAPAQRDSGGRYHVVVSGALATHGELLGPPACVWHSGDEAPMALHAGAAGLEVLVLQYPAFALDPEPQRMARRTPGA